MKRNPMLRIVLWSLLALVLLGILITGLFGYVGRNHYRTSTEATVAQVDLGQTATGNATQEAIPETVPIVVDISLYLATRDTAAYARPDKSSEIIANYPKAAYLAATGETTTVDSQKWSIVDGGYIPMDDLFALLPNTTFTTKTSEEAPGYALPNTQGAVKFTFPAGTVITIAKIEGVDGEAWGFEDSMQVWVPMKLVELGQDGPQETIPEATAIPEKNLNTLPDTPVETGPTTAPADGIPIDPSRVQSLEIEWPAGSVTIAPSDVDQIILSETPVDRPEEQLAYSLHGRTLHIRYYEKKTNHFFSRKELTILVPRDFSLLSLDLDTASADATIRDMTIQDADVDGASGSCRFEDCQLGSLSVDTASGDVFVSGTATELDLDCVSSTIQAQLTNVPREISSDTTSGSLELTLPKDAGFTLELETISGSFRSDFDTTKNGSIYRCGDGRCEIEVDSVSGGVTIRKGA